MVINEKGLMKAMKRAYSKEGYKVACRGTEDPELLISGSGWWVVMDQKNTPRKILGLIAEHLGKLPAPGEALQVAKAATQVEIFNMISEADMAEEPLKKLRPTALRLDGYHIWQREGDLAVFQIRPSLEALLLDHGRNVLIQGDDTVIIVGKASRVAVSTYTGLQKETSWMQHLSKIPWVKFDK